MNNLGLSCYRIFCLAALLGATTAPLWFAPAAGRGAEQSLALSDLEHQLDASPVVAADNAKIAAADQAVIYEGYRANGFDYFLENAFGPRRDIVTENVANETLRYAQRVGVQIPLAGSRLTEQLGLLSAHSKSRLARIEAEGDRRQILAKLRDNYVTYWQYDREQSVVAQYLKVENSSVRAARSLMRDGFWTQGDYLGFLDGLSRFRTDLRDLRSSRRTALAEIRAVLNQDVGELTPRAPDFELSCAPSIDRAVATAADNDAEIARLEEQAAEATASLDFVRHSSVAAHLVLGAGTTFDEPHNTIGWDLGGGLSVLLPQHMKPEEDAQRAEISAEIQMYRAEEAQRRADIRAAVLKALDDVGAARDEWAQVKEDELTRREGLREARVRVANIVSIGATGFAEVQTKIADAYVSDRAESTGLGTLYHRLNTLEQLVPNACLKLRFDSVLIGGDDRHAMPLPIPLDFPAIQPRPDRKPADATLQDHHIAPAPTPLPVPPNRTSQVPGTVQTAAEDRGTAFAPTLLPLPVNQNGQVHQPVDATATEEQYVALAAAQVQSTASRSRQVRMWVDDAAIGDDVNQFQYLGHWEHLQGRGDGRSAGTSARSFHLKDSATITFVGTGIELYGVLGPRGGLARIIVDGNASIREFYAPKVVTDALVYKSPRLKPGTHTLIVKTVGAHPERSLGNYVNIDGAVVISQR